ncbi:hypothetical protein CPB86DRAFT_788429 [Serendipita vermifera]|nr:hypothetical protein CPB86DRAFT_788429 [Serendipita vermifera]
MSNSDYKSAKESFVSNQTGSTLTHINLISFIAFSSLFLYSSLRTRITSFPPKSSTGLFVAQFGILVLPLLGSVTYAARGLGIEALKWNALLLSCAAIICLRYEPKVRKIRESLPNLSPNPSRVEFISEGDLSQLYRDGEKASPTKNSQKNGANGEPVPIPRLPAVSTWRAHMMLMTVISILAVDFPIFPRSLVKCETFGVSLMDLGVGSFVFAQGVASALPLLKDPDHLSGSIIPKVLTSVKKTSPLILIGIIRLILVKGTDYPGEHVSEYGTHWNFFLTLAIIPPLQMSLQPLFRYLPVTVVGLAVAILHQVLLSWTPLQDWALYASRTDFITHNKEGITSIPGYLSIHLLGLSIGLLIFPATPSHFRRMINTQSQGTPEPTQTSKSKQATSRTSIEEDRYGTSSDEDVAYPKLKDPNSIDPDIAKENGKSPSSARRDDGKTAIELCSYGVLYLILFAVLRIWPSEDDVSRRLANLQYVLWVTAFNIFFLLLYIFNDIFFYPSPHRKRRATDMAAQLGPTAPATTDDIRLGYRYAASTALDAAAVNTDYGRRKSLGASGRPRSRDNSAPNSRPSSRQGQYLAVDNGNDFSEPEASAPLLGGATNQKKRKAAARKSWDGRELNTQALYSLRADQDDSELKMLGEGEVEKRISPELLEAINLNGLLIFLLANVLTGLINLSIQTIYMPDGVAMGILSGYLLGICVFAWTFRHVRLLKL